MKDNLSRRRRHAETIMAHPFYDTDRAVYLPALATVYVQDVSNSGLLEKRRGSTGTIPEKLSSVDQLNILKGECLASVSPYALYSAGHADRDPATGPEKEQAVHGRGPETFLVTDSGGYQAIKRTGSIKITWNHVRQYRRQLAENFDWQVRVGDAGLTYDFPLRAITAENKKGRLIHPGMTYDECLRRTNIAVEVYAELIGSMADKPKFINCVHGRTLAEAITWWKTVRRDCFAGWAFAGALGRSLEIILVLLHEMWRAGDLEECWHLHFLGVSKSHVAATLTYLQRKLRNLPNVNPFLTISFDTGSATLAAGRSRKWATGYRLNKVGQLVVVYAQLSEAFSTVSGLSVPNDAQIMRELGNVELSFPGAGPLLQDGMFSFTDIVVPIQNADRSYGWDALSNTIMSVNNYYWELAKVHAVNVFCDATRGNHPDPLNATYFREIMEIDRVLDEAFDAFPGGNVREVVVRHTPKLAGYF